MPDILRKTRHELLATWMRAGTSKGVFINRSHLPACRREWGPLIVGLMGSRIGDPLQIDGLGGGTSTTSKVAIVSPSSRPNVDVEFTFGQARVGEETVDFSGTCGNILSGVGPFALDEGMVEAEPGLAQVSINVFDTNTSRVFSQTIEVDENGRFEERGDFRLPGVKGTGSEIRMTFLDPVGGFTGSFFPTSNRQDIIRLSNPTNPSESINVVVSLVDVVNPFVFVDASTIPLTLMNQRGSVIYLSFVEDIRRSAAVLMGIARSTQEAAAARATPKIALVWPPMPDLSKDGQAETDMFVEAYSMGRLHPSFQLSGAACVAATAGVEGSVVNRHARPQQWSMLSESGQQYPEYVLQDQRSVFKPTKRRDSLVRTPVVLGMRLHQEFRIGHRAGTTVVGVTRGDNPSGNEEWALSVSRTARKLFKGTASFYSHGSPS